MTTERGTREVIKTPPELRALTSDLFVSVWTHATIAALFESGVADQLREPRSVDEVAARCPGLPPSRIEHCLALAASVGVVVADGARFRLADGVVPFLQQPMRASLQGDLRSTLLQAVAFMDAAAAGRAEHGWRHTDRAILQAQGDASIGVAGMFKMNLIPSLGDLGARLERPEARFLDIGVGVASLAIAMCRMFPQLRVVGLDASDVPLAIARENVSKAGLTDRIELRRLGAEKLADESAFDLAWLPSFFIPEEVLPEAIVRVGASLRPGGWLALAGGANPAADAQRRAVFGLVNDLWGGPSLTVARAESLLKEAGLREIRTIPGPPSAPVFLVAQR
jgi:SAM-dependent methyltransferase